MVLDSLEVKNFTVFPDAMLRFAGGLNVIVGENGLGKSHLLKLPYAVMAVSAEEGRKPNGRQPTKALLRTRLAGKLVGVFRPERLGRLARRQKGHSRCEVTLTFNERETSIGFSFSTASKSEVEHPPSAWRDRAPVFLPTGELLTIYPGFVSLYETHYLEFDETWRDTCLLLGSPTVKGQRASKAAEHREPLEAQIGGRVVLKRNGRFYLRPSGTYGASDMEMPLVAEGWRKLAMLAQLIAAGSLLDKGCLFWDEPESNLNPKLIREVARAILRLCQAGVQVFVATHSLFLLREFEVLLHREFADVEQPLLRIAHRGDDGVGGFAGRSDRGRGSADTAGRRLGASRIVSSRSFRDDGDQGRRSHVFRSRIIAKPASTTTGRSIATSSGPWLVDRRQLTSSALRTMPHGWSRSRTTGNIREQNRSPSGTRWRSRCGTRYRVWQRRAQTPTMPTNRRSHAERWRDAGGGSHCISNSRTWRHDSGHRQSIPPA